ncbi:MAG TPA: translation initiation factor IF-2 subunit gamma [Candidatus Nanoarchaeia archaeon]|nr:translation initiation factor IF-2 subunit gamma [Candidatus Nanoarchaeia archaeon]
MPRKKEFSVQPEMNIGLIGHVDHGKTTLTERLSGKWTDTHSEELKRGITIRLGYADTSFWRLKSGKLVAANSQPEEGAELLRRVSFVDAPGHESLMATMLSGATIMDAALLLIAASEKCPQPQTREHVMALEIMGVKHIVVVQNKIDAVSRDAALKSHQEIRAFLAGTIFRDAPVIPISALHNVNIDMLISAMLRQFPVPEREEESSPIMFVARSFDINRPGTEISALKGGVLGGAIVRGRLKVSEEIEIRPGHEVEEKNKKVWKPLRTRISSIMAGGSSVQEAAPGGSIGVLTMLDPSVVKSDKLTGNIVGIPGRLPPILHEMHLETHLLERVVGSEADIKVDPIKANEPLMLNVNAAATVGIVTKIKKDSITCTLKLPVCAEKGSRVTISRRIGNRFRLIGYGVLQ